MKNNTKKQIKIGFTTDRMMNNVKWDQMCFRIYEIEVVSRW